MNHFSFAVTAYKEMCAARRHGQRLLEALAPAQAHDPIDEIVVVDDGSEDHAELAEFLKGQPKVKYCHNEENRGVFGNKIEAVAQSSGEWVITCDSDNLMAQDFLNRTDISAVLDQHGGHAVPQAMWGELPAQSGATGVFLKDAAHRMHAQATAKAIAAHHALSWPVAKSAIGTTMEAATTTISQRKRRPVICRICRNHSAATEASSTLMMLLPRMLVLTTAKSPVVATKIVATSSGALVRYPRS